MNQTLVESDLLVLSNGTLAAFDQRVAAIPRDLSAPFHEEARQLEAELLTVYRVAVLCTKTEDDLDRVAQWWGAMVRVCDEFAGRLSKLVREYPHCGAEQYYDRVLELRSKCERLQKMHSEPPFLPNGSRSWQGSTTASPTPLIPLRQSATRRK